MNPLPAHAPAAWSALALAALLACRGAGVSAEPAAPAPAGEAPVSVPTTAPSTQPDDAAEPEPSELDRKLIETSGGHELDKINALLDQGADPNALGGAALCRAALRDRAEVVKLLLRRGANPNAYDGCRTALGYAAVFGYTDVADLLTANGADLNRGRCLPLHDATASGKVEVVMLLIGRGADVNAPGVSGRSALHVAARHGNVRAEQLFIGAGADVNARDDDGHTPLFYAVANNEKDAAVFLLSCGADVNPKDRTGQSLLTFAKKRDQHQMLDLLSEHGARE